MSDDPVSMCPIFNIVNMVKHPIQDKIMIMIMVMMRRSRRKVSGVDQETGVKVRHIWQEAVGGIREGIAPWPRPRDHQLEPPSTSYSQVCRSLVQPPCFDSFHTTV